MSINKFPTPITANTSAQAVREQFPHGMKDAESYAKEYQPVISEPELRALSEGDPTLETLFKAVIDYSCRYAADVMQMQEFVALGKVGDPDYAEELALMEDSRKRLHNATMDSFVIFSRALGKAGRDASWIAGLNSRAATGLLALQLGVAHFLAMDAHGENHEQQT